MREIKREKRRGNRQRVRQRKEERRGGKVKRGIGGMQIVEKEGERWRGRNIERKRKTVIEKNRERRRGRERETERLREGWGEKDSSLPTSSGFINQD